MPVGKVLGLYWASVVRSHWLGLLRDTNKAPCKICSKTCMVYRLTFVHSQESLLYLLFNLLFQESLLPVFNLLFGSVCAFTSPSSSFNFSIYPMCRIQGKTFLRFRFSCEVRCGPRWKEIRGSYLAGSISHSGIASSPSNWPMSANSKLANGVRGLFYKLCCFVKRQVSKAYWSRSEARSWIFTRQAPALQTGLESAAITGRTFYAVAYCQMTLGLAVNFEPCGDAASYGVNCTP